MVDIVTRLGKGSPLTNAEVDANFTNLAEVSGVTGEPMGHEDRTTSTISFNASTRTFTIAPVASSFTVWCKGKKVVVSSAQTVTIPNTTGMYSIYYDANGVLSAKSGYFTFSLEAPTAYVYWNAATGTAPYFGDERHGVVLDWQTHEYLHRTRGAAIANGFLASGYTLNNSATNAATQIAIESGTFFDEDMKIDIVSTATPTAGTYQQNLLFPAKIPALHLQGTSWVMDAPTDFPFKQGTSRPQYNSLSGGVWSTADVGNNQHATTWILATNNLTYPVIAIIGQSATDNLGEAEAFSFADLTLTGFPSVEFRPLYKLIYKASDGYANSVNAQLVSIVDLRSISAVGSAANPATDHGNLSGLSDDDHPQYIHVDTLRTVSDAVKASFLPSQTSNAGKFLQTDGTATSWQALTSGNVTTALGFTPYNATNPSGYISGISSSDVTTALGFTPYNATNPSGYVTAAGARGAISVTGAGSYDSATGVINIVGGVTSFNTRTGAITLSSADVTTALGFTPYNSNNPNGYLTSSALLGYLSFTGGGTVTAATTFNGGITVRDFIDGTNTVGSNFNFLTNRNGNQTLNIATADLIAGTDKYVFIGTGSASHVSSTTTVELGASTPGSITRIWSPLEIGGNTAIHAGNKDSYTYPPASHTHSYLPLSGGTLTGRTIANLTGRAFTIGGSPAGAPNAAIATQTSYLEIAAGSGSITNSSGLIFHNPNVSTAVFEYVNTAADTAYFNLRSDDTTWDARVNGNVIIHAGNKGSYTYPPESHTHSYLPLSGGTMSGTLTFASGVAWQVLAPGSGTYDKYVQYINSSGYTLEAGLATDSIAASKLPITFTWRGGYGSTGGLQLTGGSAATLGGNVIIHAGNYNSYSPTLTGGGASGTWGVSISGNAATATTATNQSGGAVNATSITSTGQLVVNYNIATPTNYYNGLQQEIRATSGTAGIGLHRNGYSHCGIYHDASDTLKFNMNSGTVTLNASIGTIIGSGNYNSYAPTLTGGGASGTWGINITGSAGSISASAPQLAAATESNSIYVSAPSYTTGSPVKLLNFDWYGNTWAIGNIRSGATPSDGFGVYFQGSEKGRWSSSGYGFQVGTAAAYDNPGGWNANIVASGLYHARVRVKATTYNSSGDNEAYLWVDNSVSPRSGLYSSTAFNMNVAGGLYESGSRVLNSSNYNSYALPISGGTLTGGLTTPTMWVNYSTSNYNNYNENIRLAAAGNGVSVIAFGASGSGGQPWNSILGFSDRFEIRQGSQWQQRNWTDHVEAYGSFRAPIFYDSNDTAYYTDPSSTSSMFGVAIRGDNSSTGTSNQLFLWGAGTTTTSAIGFKANGGYFLNPTGNGDGYNTYLTMDTPGRGWVFREGSGGSVFTANYTSGWILNNGLWQANASMRAPIFYDSNNTGYYVDPASTSNLSGLTVNGRSLNLAMYYQGFTLDANTMDTNATGFTYAVNAPAFGPIARFSTGGGYDLWLNAPYNGGGNNLYFRTRNGDTGSINSWRALASYGINYGDSLYATIYYDSNDTGRYLDPASTSNLSTVKANVFCGNDGNGYGIYKGYDNNNHFIGVRCVVGGNTTTPTFTGQHATTFVEYAEANDTSGWFFKTSSTGNYDVISRITRSYSYFESSVRSPLFYDSNDTAYYVDPNSTGISFRGRGQMFIGPNSSGRYTRFGGDGGATDEATLSASNGNLHIDCKGGYATYINYYTTNNVYSYGNLGLGSDSASFRLHVHGTGYATSDFRAPIFYDSNDTAYYVDPAGTSMFRPGGVFASITDLGYNAPIRIGDTQVGASGGSWVPMISQTSLSNSGYRQHTVFGSYRGQVWGSAFIAVGGNDNYPTVAFYFNYGGDFTSPGNVTAYSDERLKTNWRNMPEDFVTRLAQVKVGIYDRVDNQKTTQVGVSAQSLQKLLPQAVIVGEDEAKTLSVSYGNAALASAVELAKEVVDLRNRVAHLESLISKLIGD